jgi:predicted alpha/beta hydrolase family esterase
MGPGPHVKDWAVGFSGGEEAHYRRWWRAPYAAVRLLRTRRPTPKEYDSWARAPVSEARPLLSAKMKRRIQAVACSSRGGSSSLHTEVDAQEV